MPKIIFASYYMRDAPQAQLANYVKYIGTREGVEKIDKSKLELPATVNADVFYDFESGLRRNGRTELDKMLRKAVKGKIDYIIAKLISRESRDTLEVLKIIRFLRGRGINMHFETENVDSINIEAEFEITLRGMLAQDESRNTSENIQWGFKCKFEKGDIFTKYKNFMGYDCLDGEIVIVPEQAEVVRKISGLTISLVCVIHVIYYE